MIPVQCITLEELLESNDINELESWDDLEYDYFDILNENANISELMHEYMISEISYDAAHHLGISTEGEKWDRFKNTVKGVFLKIIGYIKKAVLFIIKIITWPFRMIAKFFHNRNMRKIAETVSTICDNNNIPIKSVIPQKTAMLKKTEPIVEKVVNEYKKELTEAEKEYDEIYKIVKTVFKEVKTNNSDFINEIKRLEYTYTEQFSDKQIDDHFHDTLDDAIKIIKTSKASNIKMETYIDLMHDLLNLSSNAYNLKRNADAVTDQLKNLEKLSETLAKEIINTTVNINDDVRILCSKALNHIRRRLVNVAQNGINIFKYFNTINENIDIIQKVVGYNAKHPDIDIYKNKIFDKIAGISIACDDNAVLDSGGACKEIIYVSGGNNALSDADFARSLISGNINNHGNMGTSGGGNSQIIVVSTVIKAWKDSHPKWYQATIGHEIGHMGHEHNFNITRSLDIVEYNIDESKADRAGINLTENGMTKEEYTEYRIALVAEGARLHKIKNTILDKHKLVSAVMNSSKKLGIRYYITEDSLK